MQATLEAIAHPQRRQILRLVWDAELSSREIAGHFDVTWQAVSHNLRVLRENGLVTKRREGTRRFYRADRERLGAFEKILVSMWEADLDRLAHLAERADGKERSE